MGRETTRETARPLSVDDALAAVLRAAVRGPVERVAVSDAAGRVLADRIVATEDLWPFARAAMDGVAARSADVAQASVEHPVRLRVSGAVYAGQAADGLLRREECVRVATGAPVPFGADTVIPQELLRAAGVDVVISQPAPPGQHIFPAGEDVRAGECVLEPGVALGGGHVGLLASMGYADVPVVRRPLVAILTCGDELVPPGEPLKPGLVRESNRFTLAADVRATGARAVLLDTARDNERDLDNAVRRGLEADVLVTSGGLSVGERDLVRPALRRAGVTIEFEAIAMKPGARVAFGRVGHRLIFGLPGTPSACRVAFHILAVPALRALQGYREPVRPEVVGRLAAAVRVRPGRRRYLWALATLGEDGIAVAPHMVQSTATLRAAGDANALIVLDADAGDVPAGSPVRVRLLDPAAITIAPANSIATASSVTAASRPNVIGIVGARGAGKTTLIERLIPALARLGVSVAVVKHHGHQRAIDEEGSDTARAASAGAVTTVLTGPGGTITRTPAPADPSLDDAVARAGPADLVFVEGFSRSPIPKILVLGGSAEPAKAPPAGPIVATVGDGDSGAVNRATAVAHFGWDQSDELARFILSRRGVSRA